MGGGEVKDNLGPNQPTKQPKPTMGRALYFEALVFGMLASESGNRREALSSSGTRSWREGAMVPHQDSFCGSVPTWG